MTAVEWLLNELSIAGYFPYGIPPKIEEQAKEIEQEQKINALVQFSKAHFDIHTEEAILYITDKAEQYYNELNKSE